MVQYGEEWKEIQKRTFIKWTNAKLKGSGEITSLGDLGDGIVLGRLVSVLDPEFDFIPNKGVSKAQKIDNVNVVLAFLNEKQRLINIGCLDIVETSEKLALGLIWSLILRYSVQSGMDPAFFDLKKRMLNWCRAVCKNYEGCDIRDFTTSWQNGLGFKALIHHFRPDLINYADEGAERNIETAFDVAEKNLDISRLIDVDDVLRAMDEKSLMTYLSQFYDKFRNSVGGRLKEKRASERQDKLRAMQVLDTEIKEKAKIYAMDLQEFRDREGKIASSLRDFFEYKKQLNKSVCEINAKQSGLNALRGENSSEGKEKYVEIVHSDLICGSCGIKYNDKCLKELNELICSERLLECNTEDEDIQEFIASRNKMITDAVASRRDVQAILAEAVSIKESGVDDLTEVACLVGVPLDVPQGTDFSTFLHLLGEECARQSREFTDSVLQEDDGGPKEPFN